MKTTSFGLALGLWVCALAPQLRAGEPKGGVHREEKMSTTQPAKHANRLIHATSPYLLQHAHNPVDWYEWGPEAIERARNENKPIFLSIGYAACHWCHVMERESFEDEEIARIMNKHFVCIKVDREERPDIDDIYMNATIMLTGSGGWPMSVFLSPDLKPFYAGTYFPPESRYGRPGFKDVLARLAEVWEQQPDDIKSDQQAIVAELQKRMSVAPGDQIIPADLVARTARALTAYFDRSAGGFQAGRNGNKFPPSMAMELMLRQYTRSVKEGSPENDLLHLVQLTCDRMAAGGIYDQLGGGIARYSTDPQWLAPHFEKMLYDQAMVSGIYLSLFQVTREDKYARVAGEILDYVINDLQSPEGGYYSTRDADSEGVEGKYYVWSRREIESALGPEDAKLFCSFYDVTDAGNWEGHNILNVPREIEVVAKLNGVSVDTLRQRLAEAKTKLLTVRGRRVPPALDDKVLTAWNGLMITSMARGYRILREDRFRASAEAAASFVLDKMTKDGRLLRSFRAGKAHLTGYLDDYAFLIEGLLHLYQTTFDPKWLVHARDLNELVINHYWDGEQGGFFYTAHDAEKLLLRGKDAQDGAIPSGNSVQVLNLLRLAILLDQPDLRRKAEQTMKLFGPSVMRSPGGYERFCWAVDLFHADVAEIALVGPREAPPTKALIEAVYAQYLPNKVLALLDSANPPGIEVPLLKDKTMRGDKPTAYVCRNYVCKSPVTTVDELIEQLAVPDLRPKRDE